MAKMVFNKKIGLKFEEETSTVLQLKYSCVWCWNLDTSASRSEIPGKFRRSLGYVLY